MDIQSLIALKKQELIQKAKKKSLKANYHIYLNGEHYKSFKTSAKREEHMNTIKFFKKALGKKLCLFYTKNDHKKEYQLILRDGRS